MTLSQRLESVQDNARSGTQAAIDGLAVIAERLHMNATHDDLVAIGEDLRADRFRIIVVGRFSAGKSTLLNCLLADVTHPVDLGGALGPLPADLLPTTAVLTQVVYSEQPYVKVWGFDGHAETWSLQRFVSESPLDTSVGAEDKQRFSTIARFELGYPARLLLHAEVYDAPGLDEEDARSLITTQAAHESDAVIVVFSSHALMGQQELTDSRSAVTGKFRAFTVVNLFQPAQADRRMRGHVWNKWIRTAEAGHDLGPYADQDLERDHRVHFVDAHRSLLATRSGDEIGVKANGLPGFEAALSTFLATERAAAHIYNHAVRADVIAQSMDKWIRDRKAAATAKQADFEAWRRKMVLALNESEQRASVIRDVVDRHQRDTVSRLEDSLVAAERTIQTDIEAHLATEAEIPSLTGAKVVVSAMRANTVKAELEAATTKFVEARRTAWLRDEAEPRLTASVARLHEDLTRELQLAVQPLEDARLAMPSQEDFASGRAAVSRVEQIAAGALAVLTGNALVAAGAGGGFRTVLPGIGGLVLGAFAVAALGFGAPVAIPAAIILAAIASMTPGIGLRGRLIRKIAPSVRSVLAGSEPELRDGLANDLKSKFDEIRTRVENDLRTSLDRERDELQEMIRLREHEDAQRRERLAILESVGGQVEQYSRTLRAAAAEAPQQQPRASA